MEDVTKSGNTVGGKHETWASSGGRTELLVAVRGGGEICRKLKKYAVKMYLHIRKWRKRHYIPQLEQVRTREFMVL